MIDHETSEAVAEAAQWYANTTREERGDLPEVPLLRERFGLSVLEACEALAVARKLDRAVCNG